MMRNELIVGLLIFRRLCDGGMVVTMQWEGEHCYLDRKIIIPKDDVEKTREFFNERNAEPAPVRKEQ